MAASKSFSSELEDGTPFQRTTKMLKGSNAALNFKAVKLLKSTLIKRTLPGESDVTEQESFPQNQEYRHPTQLQKRQKKSTPGVPKPVWRPHRKRQRKIAEVKNQ